MPKTTEELAASTGGSTAETNGFGGQERAFNRPGVYAHPKKPEITLIARRHPLYGNAQADGMVRLGFEWMRDATSEELAEKYIQTTGAPAADPDTLKGIQARLNALEAENTALKAEKAAGSNDVLGDSETKQTKKEDK